MVKSGRTTRSKKKLNESDPSQSDAVATQSHGDEQAEQTAYERILSKVQENRMKRGASSVFKSPKTKKTRKEDNSRKSLPKTTQKATVTRVETRVVEDDNFVDMEVTDVQKIFPNEDEDGFNEEDSEGEESEVTIRSKNNNATVASNVSKSPRTQRSVRALPRNETLIPHCSTDDPGRRESEEELRETLGLMKQYMVEKGVINKKISTKELNDMLRRKDNPTTQTGTLEDGEIEDQGQTVAIEEHRQGKARETNRTSNKGRWPLHNTESEVTLYKRAVKLKTPDNSDKPQSQQEQLIDKLLTQTRISEDNNRISSSSDEFMDISDESNDIDVNIDVNKNNTLYSETSDDVVAPRRELNTAQPQPDGREKEREMTNEEQADQLIKDAELNKAQQYQVPGKVKLPLINMVTTVQNMKPTLEAKDNLAEMDMDYQMVDSHLDEMTKLKIQAYEFVDFAKLLVKNRSFRDDESGQRLEIINRNGQSFLSPVSEHEATSITNYNRWEQAFRIFSNVLTSKYPGKATELLQYNHTIHTASMSYIWENVYAYDKEFRHHIARHPTRTWGVILQQAWTMLLKDRVKSDNNSNFFQKGRSQNGNGNGKSRKEPCRRFNKGRCTFGLSCRFDHRCSVPECGKWGHGAHICRLRQSTPNAETSGRRAERNANHKN